MKICDRSNFQCKMCIHMGAGGHLLWLGEVKRSPPTLFTSACVKVGRPCFSSSDVFCFVGLPFFPSASWPLSFLSLFLSFSSSSDLAWFMRDCLRGVGLLCMDKLLAFMEWAGDGGNRPAAWSYVPVRFSSCSLRVFYMTLAVGKDTY